MQVPPAEQMLAKRHRCDIALGARRLPAGLLCAVLNYLSTSELVGLYVTSKGMRALVWNYMSNVRATAEVGGPGYCERWRPGCRDAKHSVCRLARQLRSLRVTRRVECDELVTALVRVNAATLQSFFLDAKAASPPCALLEALAGCPQLTSLRLQQPAYEEGKEETEGREAASAVSAFSRLFAAVPRLRILETAEPLPWKEVLRGAAFSLEEVSLRGMVDFSPLLLPPFARLVALTLDSEAPSLAVLASFSRAVPAFTALQRLAWLTIPRAFESFRATAGSPAVWTFPALTSLFVNYALCRLPRLRAPELRLLSAFVVPSDLSDLMEGCPRLERLDSYRGDAVSGEDTLEEAGLAARILLHAGPAASAPASASVCRWATSLRALELSPSVAPLHPASMDLGLV